MGIILGVWDEDPERATAFQSRLPVSLSGLPHLERRQASFSKVTVFWEAPVSTPVSTASKPDGDSECWAWVLGDCGSYYAPGRNAADEVLQSKGKPDAPVYAASGQTGYYTAVVVDADRRLTLATDMLGYFPLYYWENGSVILFGTSPELFNHHPAFVASPCGYAIASLLMFSHVGGCRAIYEGVRRNASGCLVEWVPYKGTREVEANPLRPSDDGFHLTYQETLNNVRECMEQFHRGLGVHPQIDFYLSGGQDSRMLAGYVALAIPTEAVRAVSLGASTDTELRYARSVSRRCGWQHRYADADFNRYVEYANAQLRLESLQGPFVNFANSMGAELLAEREAPFISGYLGDMIIGDKHMQKFWSNTSGEFNLETGLRESQRYGFDNEQIVDLFSDRKQANRWVEEIVWDAYDAWERLTGWPYQRAWMYWLINRVRYHVGSIVWRLSLGGWPLLPFLDRQLLEAVASMPYGYFSERRIQEDIIRTDFPVLANLPLDTNSGSPRYLVRPLQRRILDRLPPGERFSWRLHRWWNERKFRRSTRYYVRLYDFNSPGWKAIRAEAQKHDTTLNGLLNEDAVKKCLPLAEDSPKYKDIIVDSAKVKTLVGLSLWNGLSRSSSESLDKADV